MDVGLNSFEEICWARSARISECKLHIALTEDVKVEQNPQIMLGMAFSGERAIPQRGLNTFKNSSHTSQMAASTRL